MLKAPHPERPAGRGAFFFDIANLTDYFKARINGPSIYGPALSGTIKTGALMKSGSAIFLVMAVHFVIIPLGVIFFMIYLKQKGRSTSESVALSFLLALAGGVISFFGILSFSYGSNRAGEILVLCFLVWAALGIIGFLALVYAVFTPPKKPK